MLTGHGSIDTAIEAIQSGAFDYVLKPCPLDELEIRIQRALERQALAAGQPARARAHAARPRQLVHRRQPARPGGAPADRARGAERIDRAHHRRDGHRQGDGREADPRPQRAARAPVRHRGMRRAPGEPAAERAVRPRARSVHGRRSRQARTLRGGSRGTIFLDEIGEVSLATQVTLLRVLDASTFRHVGGTHEMRVDVRVLAATNRDLPAWSARDCSARISTTASAPSACDCPRCGERGADIDLLARHFVYLFSARFGSPEAPRAGGAGRAASAPVARQRARTAARRRGGHGRVRGADDHADAPAGRRPCGGIRAGNCRADGWQAGRCRRWRRSNGRTSSPCWQPWMAIADTRRGSWASASGTSTASCASSTPAVACLRRPGG